MSQYTPLESPALPGSFSRDFGKLMDIGESSSSSSSPSPARRDSNASANNLLTASGSSRRPSLPPRAASHNSGVPEGGATASSSRRESQGDRGPASARNSSGSSARERKESLSAMSDGPGAIAESQSSTRRAAMDKVRSRAVAEPGWTWERERERSSMDNSTMGEGSSSSPRLGSGSHPAPPPRMSSRAAGMGSSSSRVKTDAQAVNASASSSRPQSPLRRAAEGSSQPSTSQQHPPAHHQRDRSRTSKDQQCDSCGKPMTGQFVRALGVVFHLDCFRCRDCHKVVASKFFPATEDMKEPASTGATAGDESAVATKTTQKLFPLCETDYFRRLDLLCAKCGGALRGSYITALGMKFHVEHFTCSICPTVFGPQDSYYEHDGRVFCHFHYSTRFAIRCTGCRTAILKQFVEINRNNQDEHWHPECYMIHKFWNIKLCPTGATPKDNSVVAADEPTTDPSAPVPSNTGVAPVTNASATDDPSPEAIETEATETPSSLRKKQKTMEEQVYRIWTVLSAFEESSAACISEMLRHVSNGRYLGGVRMAERFILHVEILFSAIDDIEKEFRRESAKGMSHIREARMLCKKIVNFFSLLSHTQETGARRMGITQELLSLVTGLAHYLKILIRIALTGALKLDRDYDNHHAIVWFLDQLAYLAEKAAVTSDEKNRDQNGDSHLVATSEISMQGPDGKWYGYRSLPRSTSTTSNDGSEGSTDLCVSCGNTVEEECVRMGINMRWHTACLRCQQCKRRAHKESKVAGGESSGAEETLPPSDFSLEISYRPNTVEGGLSTTARRVATAYCSAHSPNGCRRGFETGTRLEQYAFLLRVALNRLYALLKKRGVVPASPPALEATAVTPTSTTSSGESTATPTDAWQQAQSTVSKASSRDSQDIKRMKSVNLDRKLSTKAKVPRISTVVGSPSGRQTLASSMQRISPSTDGSDSRTPSPREGSSEKTGPAAQDNSRSLRRSPSPARMAHPYASASQSDDRSPISPQPGSVIPIRPAFARHNTDVKIREDGPMRQPSGDEHQDLLSQAEDGLTLADIPQLLEKEQAREQHRPLQQEGHALSELSALELFIVKHMAVMMLQQSPLKDMVPMDDLIEFIETRKNTFWGKLFKGGKDKKKVEKKGVFGIPLEMLIEKNGADSTLGASATHLRVPSFIDDIISAMKQMDVSVEGIFRKNGNIRRLKELSEALDRDASSVNLADDNPVQLAALLKKFLRELPDPLLTFKLHRLFVMSQKIEPEAERIRCLQLVSLLLPKAHRDTLEVLFVFLKWVASFSHVDEETGSKMDLQNLALVLGPNILYAKSADPAKDELFLANRAILCLLEHQDDFWLVPPELEAVLQDRELLNSSADLTSRDILKRCEKYAKRAKNGGATPGRYPAQHPGGGSGSSGHHPGRGVGGSGGHNYYHNPNNNGSPHSPNPSGSGGGMYMSMESALGRPEYHDGRSHESFHNNGSTGRGGYPRSPLDDEDRANSSRPPWAQQQQQGGYQQSQPTYYGSPDRSQYQGHLASSQSGKQPWQSQSSGSVHLLRSSQEGPGGGRRQMNSSEEFHRDSERGSTGAGGGASSYGSRENGFN